MKYLYVLVSDYTDYYYEQALMSITSLKMKMPDGFVSLLIDDTTEKTLIDQRRNILELVNELKVIPIDTQFNKIQRSRWLKTSMRQHIEGDFLYIDCDTIITDDLAEIEKWDIILGAVVDWHQHLNQNPPYKKWIQNMDKKLGFKSSLQLNNYFNGGLLFCKDIAITHDFFSEWHRLWLFCKSKGLVIDQPSLNQANFSFNNIITEIGGIWNCMISYDGAIIHLNNSKIIHYQSSNILSEKKEKLYLMANLAIFHEIKEKGYITQDIQKYLQNPKSSFNDYTRLIMPDKFIDSLSFIFIKKLFNMGFFIILEFILFQTSRLKRAIHKLISIF
jgi:hypothetical protein